MEWEPTSAVIGVCADDSPGARGDIKASIPRKVTLKLDAFGWEALEEQAIKLGVSIEELASFSVLYYLADHDSGRIARLLPKKPPAINEPHPLGKLLGG